MLTQPRHLFVYGTLRRAVGHPLHGVIASSSEFAGVGWLPGYLLDLGAYPGLVAPEDAGGLPFAGQVAGGPPRVLGEVYRLKVAPRDGARNSATNPLLERLDRYEGCTTNGDRRAEYRRVPREVVLEQGGTAQAWVYLYNPRFKARGGMFRPRLILGGDYLNRGNAGASGEIPDSGAPAEPDSKT